MPKYDAYEAYREPLTEEELERIAQAEREEKEKGPAESAAGVAALSPAAAVHVEIALERAEKQFEGWPVLPEDSSVAEGFPGVDPEGKYSVIDMSFARRKAQIEANLESRSPEVQSYVRRLFQWGEVLDDVKAIQDRVGRLAQEHRKVTRAAKLCHDETGREYLQRQAAALEEDTALKQMDLYLQGIEYAAGVRRGPVPAEVEKFYYKFLQHGIDKNMLREAQRPNSVPGEIRVEFQNLENKYKQTAFANPHNWGKRFDELEKGAFALADAPDLISPYARATANRVIDPLFSEVENVDASFKMSRGDYILIDGKSLRERIHDSYVASGQRAKDFDEYYRNNCKQLSGDYVAAALMAGKRVEVYVPDKNGRIPDKPTQLTKSGYEPAQRAPVVLNAWQRFWSKLGFYKEKAAAAEEYSRTVSARERMQSVNTEAKMRLNSINDKRMKASFFGERAYQAEGLPDVVPGGYSVTRSALTTVAVCAMLKDGHSVEDILDPEKLQAAKLAVGDEVLKHMTMGDQNWLAEVFFHGQRKLADYLDTAAKRINVLDDRQLFSDDAQPLFFAAGVAFDASQEKNRCNKEYLAVAERHSPGKGEALVEEINDRVSTMGMFYDYAGKSLSARNSMMQGAVEPDDTMATTLHLINFEAARKQYAEKMAQSPKTPMSRQFTIATSMGFFNMGSLVIDKPGTKALEVMLRDRKNQRAMGKAMLSGEAQKWMKVSADVEKGIFDFDIQPPKTGAVREERKKESEAPQLGRGR